ncbi:hypothetical protein EMPS_08893 [Entomortierella parvispora]|uniref:Uncharacterized protein n=1 Tax=Entomortierella parvispora TaxID=205924 RepID=A0A9P3HGX0_9FUNG|nr:hypothetical protein EMPS_08893 [Entomortierella parvispora]
MPQLLESTRTYLRSSTKLGRRLSGYRDDSSASEASLSEAIVPSTPEGTQPQQQHRPSPQNRLSALFTLDGWNKNSVSTEDRTSSKVRPEAFEQLESVPRLSEDDSKKKKRKSNSSRKSTSNSDMSSSSMTKDLTPLALPVAPAQTPRSSKRNSEVGMPRGRSPTLSPPATVSASSSLGSNTSEHQSNAWRRQLLEESIMHSLQLGYGAASSPRPSSSRQRSRSRSRSRSLKRNALGRSRKVREQQASRMSAAMSKDLPPCPTGADSMHLHGLGEKVVDRGLIVPTGSGRVLQEHKAVNKNSPYQMFLNPSSTNITHSFASFTLELPEHQASHVMSASVVPNLFKIKQGSNPSPADGLAVRRGRRDSASSNFKFGGNGSNYSPRVLTGKLSSTVNDDAKENRLPILPTSASVVVV